MELKNRLLEVIKEKHQRSGGKCGTKPVEIAMQLKLEYSETKEILRILHKEKKIQIREGVNTYLLFNK